MIMIDVKLLYPIGSIYMSIQDTNPSVFFGGIWKRIAKGKTLVGVDENDDDFNSSSKTGGEKEHTLKIDEMPSHRHGWSLGANIVTNSTSSNAVTNYNPTAGGLGVANMLTTGGDKPHNNMQPYYTCYIFVRTA